MLFVALVLSFVLHLLIEECEGNEIDVVEDLTIVGNSIYNQCRDSIDLFAHKGQQNEI